jgi:hypothetical protein
MTDVKLTEEEKVSYARLPEDSKRAVAKRLVLRRQRYAKFLEGKLRGKGSVLIVGDRPGPGAPTTPGYHHTPFYSIKHCSGWLNALLEVEGIDESRLVWINSANKDGDEADFALVKKLKPMTIVALGGNAKKWLYKGFAASGLETPCWSVYHPQYWKRFKNSYQYNLIPVLKLILDPSH